MTLPFPPNPFHVRVEYALAGKKALVQPMAGKDSGVKSSTGLAGNISTPVVVPFVNEKGVEEHRRLATAPTFSVMLDPGEQVIPVDGGTARAVKVSVETNISSAPAGSLQLQVPSGWRVEPAKLTVKLEHRGDKQDFEFKVFPSTLKEERAQIRAVLNERQVGIQRRLQPGHARRFEQRLLLSAGIAAGEHRECEGAARIEGRIHHGRGR